MRVLLLIGLFSGSAVGAALLARPSEAEPGATEQIERQGEQGDDLPDFVPSEKVPADSAVAFPVDI
jgi:hypothetical protein